MNPTTDSKSNSRAQVNQELEKCYKTLSSWRLLHQLRLHSTDIQEVRAKIFSSELEKADHFLLVKINAQLLKVGAEKDDLLIQKIMGIANFHLFTKLPSEIQKEIGKRSGPKTCRKLALTSRELQTSPDLLAVILSNRLLIKSLPPLELASRDYSKEFHEWWETEKRNKTAFMKHLSLAGKHLTHVHFQDLVYTLAELENISKICPNIQKIDGLGRVDFNDGGILRLSRQIALAIISADKHINNEYRPGFLQLLRQAGPYAIHLNLNNFRFTAEELRLISQDCPNIESIENLNLLTGIPLNQPPPFSPKLCARLISTRNHPLVKQEIKQFLHIVQRAGEHAIHVNFNEIVCEEYAGDLMRIFQACPNIEKIEGLKVQGSFLNDPSHFALPISLVSLKLCIIGQADTIFHTQMPNLKCLDLNFAKFAESKNFLKFTPNVESLTLRNVLLLEATHLNREVEMFNTLAELKNLHTLALKNTRLGIGDIKLPVDTLILEPFSFISSVFPCLKKLRIETTPHHVGPSALFDVNRAQTLEEICITHPCEENVYQLFNMLPEMPNLQTIYFEYDKDYEYDQISEWVNLHLPDSGDIRVVISKSTRD